MKVRELIYVLQQMDPEATVIAHANNHHHDPDDTFRVATVDITWGRAKGPGVYIGNWSELTLRSRLMPEGCANGPKLKDAGTVFASYNYSFAPYRFVRERVLPKAPMEHCCGFHRDAYAGREERWQFETVEEITNG